MNPEAPVGKPTRLGDYDLLAELGAGASGTVYKARERTSGQIVAVKVMPAELARNPMHRQRFEEEFRAASLLQHPNIVRALRYHDEETTPFLVMEYVEGESLGARLERWGRFDEAEAVQLILQMCDALNYAHGQGIIHRDVKPDNILLRTDGRAKLADLGLSKRSEADRNLTRTGRGLGTPHFMAPEQFRNARDAGVRCDVYSLGATLYMMVTGELPFQGAGPFETWQKKVKGELVPPRRLVRGLSPDIEAAIVRAVNPNPKLRHASCQELADELRGKGPPQRLAARSTENNADLWYLVYPERDGEKYTLTGSTPELRGALVQGRCGDVRQVRVSRAQRGPFEPLTACPEFSDLLEPDLQDDGMPAGTVLLNGTATQLDEPSRRAAARNSPYWQVALLFVLSLAMALLAGHLLFR
jgi:serine/threonine protein kinase